MAGKKKITPENLKSLGIARLAELLAECCDNDTYLAKRVGVLLIAEEGGDKLSANIGKRISSIARSRALVDWKKTSAYITEIDNLRVTIISILAKTDKVKAIEHLWSFIALYPDLSRRIQDSHGNGIYTFKCAARDLGKLYVDIENRDEITLAEKMLETLETNDSDIFLTLVKAMGEALGNKGRAHLKTALIKVQDDANNGWMITLALKEIADADKDVDAYIAIINKHPDRITQEVAGVAQRLLAANRPQDALMWLDKPVDNRWGNSNDRIDLTIAALEQLNRNSDAQTARLNWFKRTLSITHLRDYLKHLPDFDDVEAEQEAISHAETFPNALSALSFLVKWPALDAASRLVNNRHNNINGEYYERLNFAADTLSEKYPDAATHLYRCKINYVLDNSSNQYYPYAVRDFRHCANLAERISPTSTLPDHDLFMASLRAKHGRKTSFWNKIDS